MHAGYTPIAQIKGVKMAVIGYIRVSTDQQHLERQEELMKKINPDRIFSDKQSGKNTDRPGFQEMMAYLRKGDELHVESFSRLSRTTTDLLATVEKLNEMGVILHSHKESMDTSTPTGKLMLTVMAGISQFEREIMLERQKEGIAEAKKRNAYKGGKRKEDSTELMDALTKWSKGDLPTKYAVKISGVSRRTFYYRAKELGYKRNKEKKND